MLILASIAAPHLRFCLLLTWSSTCTGVFRCVKHACVSQTHRRTTSSPWPRRAAHLEVQRAERRWVHDYSLAGSHRLGSARLKVCAVIYTCLVTIFLIFLIFLIFRRHVWTKVEVFQRRRRCLQFISPPSERRAAAAAHIGAHLDRLLGNSDGNV